MSPIFLRSYQDAWLSAQCNQQLIVYQTLRQFASISFLLRHEHLSVRHQPFLLIGKHLHWYSLTYAFSKEKDKNTLVMKEKHLHPQQSLLAGACSGYGRHYMDG